MAMRIAPNSKTTNTVWSEGSKISYKAKYLIAQLLEMRICVLEAEVKLILARLQMNKNVGF